MKAYRPLTYLCVPYSDPRPEVRHNRYEWVTRAAASLMKCHPTWNVFSPITNSHPLTVVGQMKGDWKTWRRIDFQYLRLSCRVVVLTMWNWTESVGVTAELKYARKLGLPILYLSPLTFRIYHHEK